MATHDDARPSGKEDRNDAVQCSDEACPLEVGDGERTSTELSDMVSVPCKPLQDNMVVEFCAWDPPWVRHSSANDHKGVFMQDGRPGNECGPPFRLAHCNAPAARDPRGCDRQGVRRLALA